MRRAVPYISQWADPEWNKAIVEGADPCMDPTWVDTGFVDSDHYRFWSWRVCGLACLRSLLLYRDGNAPDMATLLAEAIQWEAYIKRTDGSINGLIYAPFCNWINEVYSFQATVHSRITLREILCLRKEAFFIIASVSPEIRDPRIRNPTKGGHLVLVTHHDSNDSITYHNPSGFVPNHMNVVLKQSEFEKFFAQRGILIPMNL